MLKIISADMTFVRSLVLSGFLLDERYGSI